MIRVLFLVMTLCISLATRAQDTTNYDKLFEKARKTAFEEKKYSEARELCRKILDKKPLYHDARVLIANTLSWERRFNEARAEIEKVFEYKPEYYDAITVLLNIEFWSGNLKQALSVSDKGISLFPNDINFKLTKARILDQLEDYEDALILLEELKKPRPKESGTNTGQTELPPPEVLAEIEKMIHDIRIKMKKNHLGALYTLEVFDKIYAPRHLLEIEGKHRFGKTTLIGRISLARRFTRHGLQTELDLYRKLNRLTYLYLNGGYSPSPVFPGIRGGFEVYRRLPHNMDCSIGGRYLHFELLEGGTKDIFILTGSLGKYYTHYWFGIRPFITPRGTGAALAALLHARRYLQDHENHITLTLGYGLTPENRIFLGENPDFYQVKAARAGIDLQKVLHDNYFLLAGITSEVSYQNNLPELSIFDLIFILGIRYRF